MRVNQLYYISFLLLTFTFIAGCTGPVEETTQVETSTKKILCSTFPIYLFALNVADGVEGVEVQLLIPADMGCPHNYSLTTQNMNQIAEADVLVINGQGMEEFLGKPVERANPEIKILDSSVDMVEMLEYSSDELSEDDPSHDHAHDHSHDHQHSGINPHFFSSPRQAAIIVSTIARELGEQFPQSAGKFRANADKYAASLQELHIELTDAVDSLTEKRVAALHDIFAYLARDAGLEIVTVIQSHSGQESLRSKNALCDRESS
jgi:zinc transport system substrate-binding protein